MGEERVELAIALASAMLEAGRYQLSRRENKQQHLLSRMMQDPQGKALACALCDSCFRSRDPHRIISQINSLLDQYGIPSFIPATQRMLFRLLKRSSGFLARPVAAGLTWWIRRQMQDLILPGEEEKLERHLRSRRETNVQINLNRLGEAILGEQEAQRRLGLNLEDLYDSNVEVISVKASSLFSQISLLDWEKTLATLKQRLATLYTCCLEHPYRRGNSAPHAKFVYLDMEEWRDLELTVTLFEELMREPRFFHLEAGIALQSYIPDSFAMQERLTAFAIERRAQGGAPIKLRLVKGANLGMERVDASLHGWEQAPYLTKHETDANFKRMLHFGMHHASSVNLGIGSHNLFDIAYALILREENNQQDSISFEMLEGMAGPLRHVVQRLAGNMLLYCPVAMAEEFHTAMAYLMRRLDENSSPENFLTHLFNLQKGTPVWNEQVAAFRNAVRDANYVTYASRRQQNRTLPPEEFPPQRAFCNEPDTDWTLRCNRLYAKEIIAKWKNSTHEIPCVIAGSHITTERTMRGGDPSHPGIIPLSYSMASKEMLHSALDTAREATRPGISEMCILLRRIAQALRLRRSDLIGAMQLECGKAISEADSEVSEAVDFAEYYARQLEELSPHLLLHEIPSQVALVASPWNFPCSIPTGGILSALATQHAVLFKPAPEAILVGYVVASTLWEAGISKELLQFIPCNDEPEGSFLITDPRIDTCLLTGATATARAFLTMRPSLHLFAETGGKNALIATALADRDLVVRDVVHSAFGYSGQKCSACSLLILEAELYEDHNFLLQLYDAASSLAVGPAWEPKNRVIPLIRPPSSQQLRALMSLEPGESWLLEPKRSPENPHLWSPGIKLGVTQNSFMHQTEHFLPLLGVMRADNLEHALELANSTHYGLTAGIHSLNQDEIAYWLRHIQAGNCYINRGITGAIVGRQPFGGCKASSFGLGMKVGGPNTLAQLIPTTAFSPQDIPLVDSPILQIAQEVGLSRTDYTLLEKSIASYDWWWREYFSHPLPLTNIIGQDNQLHYCQRHDLFVVMNEHDPLLFVLQIAGAAATCHAPFTLVLPHAFQQRLAGSNLWRAWEESQGIECIEESEILSRLHHKPFAMVRACSDSVENPLFQISPKVSCLTIAPPSLNGRRELLHYLHEKAVSYDYHRYGNLHGREIRASSTS